MDRATGHYLLVNGRWNDLGLLVAINDLQMCSFFSDSPSVHSVRDLANKAPFTRPRVGSLRMDANSIGYFRL